jgi:RNA polymerase sigma factor (sigma-70 family)
MRSLEPSLFASSEAEVGLSDEVLVARYQESRAPADFEQLVKRYERELYTFLRRFLGNAQHAEDVFQGTFLSVHLRIDQFEPGKRFRPWLYAIASNKAIDFMRRNKRHQLSSLDQASKSGESDESMVQRLASQGIGPDEHAVLIDTLDLSFAIVAHRLCAANRLNFRTSLTKPSSGICWAD